MKRIFFALLSLAVIAASCDKAVIQEPKITGYKVAGISDLKMGSGAASATVRVDLDIENPSRLAYAIDSLTAVIYNEKGARFADAVLKAPVKAASDTVETIPVYLNVKFTKPLTLLASGLLSGGEPDIEQYSFDIDTRIGVGHVSKRIKKDGIRIADIMKAVETAKSVSDKLK